MSPTATAERVKMQPFGIEADPGNKDLLVQSIPGCRLRGKLGPARPFKDSKGKERMSVDESTFMGACPITPGMRLFVNPEKLTYMIVDPLCDDESLCIRIKKFLAERGIDTNPDSNKVDGVETQKGTLDRDRMKTLIREMRNFIDASHAKVVKGTVPTMEAIEELPGNFLLNPFSGGATNFQPRYEKDFPKWVESLSRAGG